MRKLIIALAAFIVAPSVCDTQRIQLEDERQQAYNNRLFASFFQTLRQAAPDIKNLNPDETNVPDYAGMYSKALDHDATTGVLTAQGQENYARLIQAIESGLQEDYNAIQRAAGATMKLAGPQSADAFSMQGRDSSLLLAIAPPTLQSAWAAAEILELYWMQLCRDIRFVDWGTGLNTDRDSQGNSITRKAMLVLNDLGTAYKGPRNGVGVVDTSVLFRADYVGTQVGPYVSQFLLHDIRMQHNPYLLFKQYVPIAQKREFGVSWNDFVTMQNGRVPKPYLPSDFSGQRYPLTMRDLATFAHYDADTAYGPYFYALNILMGNGFPWSPTLPYYNGSMPNEGAFPMMGGADAAGALADVAVEALKVSWMNKWRSYRRLRPEAMGGLVHYAKSTNTNPYGLNASIFALHAGIDTLQLVYARNSLQATPAYDPHHLLTPTQAQTYLLSQVYPEGSPTHPAYTSGHATIAGACVTVLKAFFNDTVLITSRMVAVKANPADPRTLVPISGEGETLMTVGSELDKLAGNIATARNIAGIHYRSDADYGIELGERVAIAYLQDQCRKYTEQNFVGFEFTKFNGERVRVTAQGIQVI